MIESPNVIREYGLSKNGLKALDTFQERFEGLLDHIAGVVVTSRQNIRLALLGLFAQGHILLEDLPGVGKTLLAKTIATSVECEFSRIQFTPDLLPSDITGTSIFDMGKQTFQFIPGPIFANVVVADELNRTGPRTQSALLQAMAEGVVSADGGRSWSARRLRFSETLHGLAVGYPSTARMGDGRLVTVFYSSGSADVPVDTLNAIDVYCGAVCYDEAAILAAV